MGKKTTSTITKFFKKVYFNVKSQVIGFVKTNNRRSPLSNKVQNLQRKISLATAMYQNDGSSLLLVRVQILRKPLIDQQRFDKCQKFSNWVSKLRKLDYQRATRSFFAELKSKSTSVQFKIRRVN